MKQSSSTSDIEMSASAIDIITALAGKSDKSYVHLASHVDEVRDAISKEFSKLGLGLNEAKVLSCLVINGRLSATEIAKNVCMTRVMVYPYLNKLMNMGMVFSEFGRPHRYFSLPYDQIVDVLINERNEVIKQAVSGKEKYLRMISCIQDSFVMPSKGADNYQVLRGDNSVISRLRIMLTQATGKIIAVISDGALVRLSREGIVTDLANLTNNGINVQIKTTSRNASYFLAGDKRKLPILYETLNQGLPLSYISVDNRELLLLLEGPESGKELGALYTTSVALVDVFSLLYGKLMSE